MHSSIFVIFPANYPIVFDEENCFEVIMQPIGMRLLIQRDKTGEMDIRIPKWIGDQLGNLLLMQFDGDQLIISSANFDQRF
jgi:hypothetical protein